MNKSLQLFLIGFNQIKFVNVMHICTILITYLSALHAAEPSVEMQVKTLQNLCIESLISHRINCTTLIPYIQRDVAHAESAYLNGQQQVKETRRQELLDNLLEPRAYKFGKETDDYDSQVGEVENSFVLMRQEYSLPDNPLHKRCLMSLTEARITPVHCAWTAFTISCITCGGGCCCCAFAGLWSIISNIPLNSSFFAGLTYMGIGAGSCVITAPALYFSRSCSKKCYDYATSNNQGPEPIVMREYLDEQDAA